MHRELLSVLVWLALAGPLAAQPTAPPSAPVQVVTAAKQPVSKQAEFTGRVEAIGRVDLHAQVTGILEAVTFIEGGLVHEGDKLFQIDEASFDAAVQQARGALLQAQGTYRNAVLQRERADDLVKTNATSVAIRDQRLADEQNAQGAVIRADADLKMAQINLSYTTITAPITGKIGRALVTKGNLVGPSSGTMAVIVSQDPMYMSFPVSERDFLQVRRSGGKENANTVLVKLRFADGSEYSQPGRIEFVDVSVDPSTDTVLVRAKVPNPDGMLVADQFMRVAVIGDQPQEQIVIPQAALIADQEGVYVFVAQDGKAVIKRVKAGPEVGSGIAIETGLDVGDQVIVNGIQTLRPGAAVTVSPLPASQQVRG